VENPTDAQLRNYNNLKPPKVKSSTFHGSEQYYDAIKTSHEHYYTRLQIWNKVANAVNGDALECIIDLVKVILQRTLFGTKYPPIITKNVTKADERCCELRDCVLDMQ